MSASIEKPTTEAFDRFLTSDHAIANLLNPANAEIVEYVWNTAIESVSKPQASEATIKSDNTQTLLNALAKIDGAVKLVKTLREALAYSHRRWVLGIMSAYGTRAPIHLIQAKNCEKQCREVLTIVDQWLAREGK